MPTQKRGIFSFASSLLGGRKAEGEALSASDLNLKAGEHFAAGDYTNALAAYDAALAADPEYYPAWMGKAEALTAIGQRAAAAAAPAPERRPTGNTTIDWDEEF